MKAGASASQVLPLRLSASAVRVPPHHRRHRRRRLHLGGRGPVHASPQCRSRRRHIHRSRVRTAIVDVTTGAVSTLVAGVQSTTHIPSVQVSPSSHPPQSRVPPQPSSTSPQAPSHTRWRGAIHNASPQCRSRRRHVHRSRGPAATVIDVTAGLPHSVAGCSLAHIPQWGLAVGTSTAVEVPPQLSSTSPQASPHSVAGCSPPPSRPCRSRRRRIHRSRGSRHSRHRRHRRRRLHIRWQGCSPQHIPSVQVSPSAHPPQSRVPPQPSSTSPQAPSPHSVAGVQSTASVRAGLVGASTAVEGHPAVIDVAVSTFGGRGTQRIPSVQVSPSASTAVRVPQAVIDVTAGAVPIRWRGAVSTSVQVSPSAHVPVPPAVVSALHVVALRHTGGCTLRCPHGALSVIQACIGRARITVVTRHLFVCYRALEEWLGAIAKQPSPPAHSETAQQSSGVSASKTGSSIQTPSPEFA